MVENIAEKTGAINGVVTSKDKTRSGNPLCVKKTFPKILT